MDTITFGSFQITWLEGGIVHLDGGTMFGVVPKARWERIYPCNEKNLVELRTDPILIHVNGKNLLIEAGIGNGKMSEKQMRNSGVQKESKVEESLEKIGLTTADIDYVLMTHMHSDHACGLSKWVNGQLVPTFENAEIIVTDIEWNEMRNPNIRSRNTYLEDNWKPIEHQVRTFSGETEIIPGIKMIHTGGHSNGHAIVTIEENGKKLIHMADIMPTFAQQNVLWVLAFDDYPMDSIKAKQKWMKEGYENEAWYIFYHDAFHRAIQWDKDGKVISSFKIGDHEMVIA